MRPYLLLKIYTLSLLFIIWRHLHQTFLIYIYLLLYFHLHQENVSSILFLKEQTWIHNSFFLFLFIIKKYLCYSAQWGCWLKIPSHEAEIWHMKRNRAFMGTSILPNCIWLLQYMYEMIICIERIMLVFK